MPARTIILDCDATSSFDGATAFDLPTPFPAPDAQGVIQFNLRSGTFGRLNASSMATLVGSPLGYKLRDVGISAAPLAVTRFFLLLQQPPPTIVYAANNEVFSTILFAGDLGAPLPEDQPLLERGPYVPAGFELVIRADDGNPGTAGVVVGPYQLRLTVDTMLTSLEAADAIADQEFSGRGPFRGDFLT